MDAGRPLTKLLHVVVTLSELTHLVPEFNEVLSSPPNDCARVSFHLLFGLKSNTNDERDPPVTAEANKSERNHQGRFFPSE